MTRSYQLLFLAFLFFCNSYLVYSQNTTQSKNSYTSNYSNTTFRDILEDLSANYQFKFSYAGSVLPMDTIISRQCRSSSIDQILECILTDLPIKHRIIGSQIVFYKSNLLVSRSIDSTRFHKDSIEVKPVLSKKRKLEIYKLSLIDLLYGASVYNSDTLPVRIDTLENQEKIDSIKQRERENRRKRVRLLRKQYRSNQWGYISFNPEVSYWRMRGTTNQSIDYDIFNDYGSPDLGVSFQASYSKRIVNDIFFQAGFLGNFLAKNGTHTDYYVSFLEPGKVYQEQFEYETRFGYVNLYFQIGYEYKVGLNKIVLAAGGFSGMLVRSVSPVYFPYFETKYYVDGPPYYNANYERIEREKISYRSIVPGLIAEALYFRQLVAKTDFMVGVQARFITHSIYNREEPINEKAFTVGVRIGLRYNFN